MIKYIKLLHQILNLSKHPTGFPMYDDLHVGYKLEILLLLVAKPQLHSLHI